MPEEIQTPEEGTEEVKVDTETSPEPKQQTPPEPDYKEKFSESAREANLLRERNKALEDEIAARNSTKEPTDSDLRAAFPEWDSLSDFEKGQARRTLNAERIASTAAKKVDDLTAERSWNTGVELAIESNEKLQGKEQDFRKFASRPQYRGVPMDILVKAFLGEQPPQSPAPRPTPKPGLETGTGGPKISEKPKTLSADELKTLRTSDERAYMDYIQTHDIDPDNL